jgi:sortase A
MRRVFSGIGRVLVTGGGLLLLFVAYQLYGTGIYQARAQDDLRDQFQHTLQRAASTSTSTPSSSVAGSSTTVLPSSTTSTTTTTTTTTSPPPPSLPPAGDAVASISIPKIGVSQYVVEGVGVSDLRKGPGHYPGTSLPGEEGNAAIAGHRTTYGAPFGDLDQLSDGDEIDLRTVQGSFQYRVEKGGVFPVQPTDLSVLASKPDPNRPGHPLATLTLTTCNPKYSAAERLIVKADLVLPTDAVPLPSTASGDAQLSGRGLGLSGESSSRLPALIWGLVAAAVGALWWLLFHRYPRWTTWLVGVLPFLATLFVFYTYVERLLPANY